MGAVKVMSPFPVADSPETTPPGPAEEDFWLRPKTCIGPLGDEGYQGMMWRISLFIFVRVKDGNVFEDIQAGKEGVDHFRVKLRA
jgi:hypothetical protein